MKRTKKAVTVDPEIVRQAAYARSLGAYLQNFIPAGDATYLAERFAARADEGTVAYWPDLLAQARRLRADHSVAGLPVNEATCATHENVLAQPLSIPVWGL